MRSFDTGWPNSDSEWSNSIPAECEGSSQKACRVLLRNHSPCAVLGETHSAAETAHSDDPSHSHTAPSLPGWPSLVPQDQTSHEAQAYHQSCRIVQSCLSAVCHREQDSSSHHRHCSRQIRRRSLAQETVNEMRQTQSSSWRTVPLQHRCSPGARRFGP